MSPGILQPVLHSSWRVQWWSEFNGVGKRNSGKGSKHFAASLCFLRVSLMASGHPRAWVWCSNVQRPALLAQDKGCTFSLLAAIRSSGVRAALCSPSHLSSNPNSLPSAGRGWRKAAGSIWLCPRKINGRSEGLHQRACCQRVLSAKLAWFMPYFMCFACPDGSKEMKGTFWKWVQLPRYPPTPELLWLPGPSIILWLLPGCQLSGYSRRGQLIQMDVGRKHKVNSGVGGAQLRGISVFIYSMHIYWIPAPISGKDR